MGKFETVSPYGNLLFELAAAIGSEPWTLVTFLDLQKTLQAHVGYVYSLAGRMEQVVKRCLTLPPSPLPLAQRSYTPHGF